VYNIEVFDLSGRDRQTVWKNVTFMCLCIIV